MKRKARQIGIIVARLIVAGDVHSARRILDIRGPVRFGWSVPEARAILGAVRHANRKYGCDVDAGDFFPPNVGSYPSRGRDRLYEAGDVNVPDCRGVR